MLALKSIIFTLLFPGSVTVLIPYLILSQQVERLQVEWSSLSVAGLLTILVGAAILLRCVWDFAVTGRGTLAPIDPPTHLVVRGLYRWVRNPMYVGLTLVFAGLLIYFQVSWGLVFVPLAVWLITNWVIVPEEKYLGEKFGEEYLQYKSKVRRWI